MLKILTLSRSMSIFSAKHEEKSPYHLYLRLILVSEIPRQETECILEWTVFGLWSWCLWGVKNGGDCVPTPGLELPGLQGSSHWHLHLILQKHGVFGASVMVQWLSYLWHLHLLRALSSPGCSLSGPASCSCSWESNGQWLKCFSPWHYVGDLHRVAQIWPMAAI